MSSCMCSAPLRSGSCVWIPSFLIVASFLRISVASPVDAWSGVASIPQTRLDVLPKRSLDQEIEATEKLLEYLQGQNTPQVTQPGLGVAKYGIARRYDQLAGQAPAETQLIELQTQRAIPQLVSLPSSSAALKGKISVSKNVASMVQEENTILEQELTKFRLAAGRVAQHEEEVNKLLQGHRAAGLLGMTSSLIAPPAMLQTVTPVPVRISSPLNSTHWITIIIRFAVFAMTVGTIVLACVWVKFHHGHKLPSASRAKDDGSIYGATSSRDLRSRPRGPDAISSAVPLHLQPDGLPINRIMKSSLNLRTSPGLQAGTVDEDEDQLCYP